MLAVLTSLRALGGQTGSGQQLCVQALNLCVLGEQKLLKADDLCLEVSHMEKSRHTGLTHTRTALQCVRQHICLNTHCQKHFHIHEHKS